MNEIQRLAYLDALGIDSYISRRQLPAAAPSRRLRIVRPVQAGPAGQKGKPLAPALESEQLVVSPRLPALAVAPGIDPATAVPDARTTPASAAAAASKAPPVDVAPVAGIVSPPIFSVSATYMGGCYWLDEVPRSRDLGDNYLLLLQGICMALGLDPGQAVCDRFNWPMHHNRQLDQGQEAARHGFEGFMRARLEQRSVSSVVLLGEPEGGWFDPAVFAGLRLITTVSAWRMLKQPELKNVAWCDLKPLQQALD